MGIVTSVYISLAKASHVAKPKVNGMGKLVQKEETRYTITGRVVELSY